MSSPAAAAPVSRFLQINGLKLHYLDWGNDAARTILCVHGLRGNAHSFDGFARRFCDRFHILAVDVRGRGDSAWSPAGEYTVDAYVSDLEGLVTALRLARFSYVGTSMGGRIGMNYARHNSSHLEGFVLNDIGPDVEPAGSGRITSEAAATPDSFATLEAFLEYRRRSFTPTALLPDEVQREMALTHVRQLPSGRWRWKNDPAFLAQRAASGGIAPAPDLWRVLSRIQCPSLLLWGTESDVLSEFQARRIVRTMPDCRLAPVPGVGHAPTLLEPAAVASLEAFFSWP
ncbi:MAG: alpha/beta hydrolase [Chloroflexi bacterium]|nr:alpha/beta hydrolase [Chloroflexota bacterium]